MERFKEALIQFANSNPTLFPNNAANSYPTLIEQYFPRFFSDLQTPNHPPYAAMIYQAIRELNKKKGCSEKSISKYITREYTDLPWAHSTLLKHHLQKLCDSKELCTTHKQCYLLVSEESETGKESSEPSKKHKKRKNHSGSETSKKSSKPHKKHKKKENRVTETTGKEQIELHNRKRKRRLKSEPKSSKRAKKHEINEVTKQTLEVTSDDVQIQDPIGVGQESNHENFGCVNLEQIQTKNSFELLQPEESPDPNPVLHRNGKRVWTRSQSKTLSMEDALAASSELTDSPSCGKTPKDKPTVVEDLSNEKQQISTSPSSEKSLIETVKQTASKSPDDEPSTSPSLTEMQDPVSMQQDQQAERPLVEDEPKRRGRGRPRKRRGSKKGEVLRDSTSVANPRKNQKLLKKGKVGNKKDQPKSKRAGTRKMTRRSCRKTS